MGVIDDIVDEQQAKARAKAAARGRNLNSTHREELNARARENTQYKKWYRVKQWEHMLRQSPRYLRDVLNLDQELLVGLEEARNVCDEDFICGVERIVDGVETREAVRLAVSTLTPREQRVLSVRYGLDGHGNHTLAEVGDILQVSRERIRMIEGEAIERLRVIYGGLGWASVTSNSMRIG